MNKEEKMDLAPNVNNARITTIKLRKKKGKAVRDQELHLFKISSKIQ